MTHCIVSMWVLGLNQNTRIVYIPKIDLHLHAQNHLHFEFQGIYILRLHSHFGNEVSIYFVKVQK
jgi:hypothetical protein